MAEFETVRSEARDFGTAGFIAVERKRVANDNGQANEFLLIARGFYLRDGTARRRNFVTLPDQAEVLEFLIAALGAELAAVKAQPPAPAKPKAKATA